MLLLLDILSECDRRLVAQSGTRFRVGPSLDFLETSIHLNDGRQLDVEISNASLHTHL